MTLLDQAHLSMSKNGDDDAARMNYYAVLRTVELFLVLEEEPSGEIIKPLVLETSDANIALIFDTELRMVDFMQSPVAYLSLSGRKIVALLTGQKIALGVNLGSVSENLLPVDVVTWLQENTPDDVAVSLEQPSKIFPPAQLPETFIAALDARLAQFSGKERRAYLAQAEYANQEKRHLLSVIGLPVEAHQALASSIGEALHYNGLEAASLDVTFHASDDNVIAKLDAVGLRFDLPDAPSAKEIDVTKPPRLI